MSQQITVQGFGLPTISATEEAFDERDALLTASRRGNLITTAEGAAKVADLFKRLTEFRDNIEAARVAAKEPALNVGRQIDALAKTLYDDVKVEIDRLSRLLGTWDAEQKRLAEVERKKAFDREQAIIAEANRVAAENKKAAELEAAALATKQREEAAAAQKKLDDEKAAVDAKLAETKGKSERARLEKEKAELEAKAAEDKKAADEQAERDRQELEKKNVAASEAHVENVETAIVENRVAAAGIVATKTEGIGTKTDFDFEVTSITQVYESNPLLVDMKPNRTAIKKALKMLDEGQHIPGIRHWQTFKAQSR